jgi:hypothetical protein
MDTKDSRRMSLAKRIAVRASIVTTVLYVLVGLEIVVVRGVAEVEPGPAMPLSSRRPHTRHSRWLWLCAPECRRTWPVSP